MAFHTYANVDENHNNIFVILEKKDQDAGLVFLKNPYSTPFTSYSVGYECSVMGGSFFSTLTQMVYISSFIIDYHFSTILFKDLGTGKIYLIQNLDLQYDTIGAFYEVSGSINGSSPLL